MASDVPLILGIDLGTSSVKVALVTYDSEAHVEASLSRDIALNSGYGLNNLSHICMPNEHVQDVGKIFQCLHILLSSISPLLMARVTAVSVTGQMHGVMGWLSDDLAFLEKSKKEKKKLDVNLAGGGCGNLITWIDRRCTKEFIDALPTSTRSEKPCSGFGCASILWQMKNQPGEFAIAPLAPSEQRNLFEKAAVLRKTSVGQPSQRLLGIASVDSVCGLRELTKPRSISQSLFPPLSRPVQHAPWTCVGTIADFLVAGLSSLQRPVMSPQMAMSWGYFDLELNTWDFPALNATGYSLSHLLPEVVPCGTVVGKLSFDWEGIPAGADVFVALGDLQCSVYPFLEGHGKNAGAEGGVAACNLSTSAQIAFKIPSSRASIPSPSPSPIHTFIENTESVFESLLKSKRIAVWPFFKPDDRIVVAASLNGGNVVERFVKMLRVWCHQLGCPAIESTQIYSKLTQAACGQHEGNAIPLASTKPASGIRVDPRLFGERYCEIAEGDENGIGASVTNIHPRDIFNLPSVYAAICRGVVHNLVSMAPPELLEWANVKRIFCVGGALKRNPLMLQQLKDEYASVGITCLCDEEAIEACIGAALYTALSHPPPS